MTLYLCTETSKIDSFLYVLGAFQAAALVLEFKASEFISEKVCAQTLKRNTWDSSKQPSLSLNHSHCWFSQPDIVGTPLLGTGAPI